MKMAEMRRFMQGCVKRLFLMLTSSEGDFSAISIAHPVESGAPSPRLIRHLLKKTNRLVINMV